jgi:hypothetical protein
MVFAAGASVASRLLKANFRQVGDELVYQRLCTRQELTTALELLDDSECGFAMPLLVSAWAGDH